jgi:transketolase C-terminal domain/subunit
MTLANVSVYNLFGESGKPADLIKKHGLDAEHIARPIRF